MAHKNALGKTIATIIALTTLTLSVATGVVGGRVLNKGKTDSQQPGGNGNGQGDAVRSVLSIEKTNTYGLIDEYTITYTDGTTSVFIVTNGRDGEQGIQGFPGNDGHTPTIEIDENGHWVIDGVATSFDAVGPQGPAGQDGLTPYIGDNGNWWIGETDTGVRAEGKDGEDGYVPLIGANGHWWIGGTDTGVPAQGHDGRSIVSIDKTDSQGLIDVYTITYSDETTSTFLVTNGADGAQGQGVPGQGGYIPEITVENGKWVIDGVPTEYDAVGPQGPQGPQGISIHTGEGEPASTLGRDGDSYINLNNWDYYVMDNGAWVKVGNIHGSNGASVHSGTGDPTTNNVPGNVGDTYIDLSTGDLYEMGQDGWGNPTGNTGVASVGIGANGNWYIGGVDTGISATGPQGPAGNSVVTGAGDPVTAGATGNAGDTYIDLSTGNVYHMGENGEWGDPDANSTFAIPHIGANGHWYVGNEDTGINATGPQGASVKIGHGDPTTGSVAGNAGDTYIDLDTGYYYIYDENNGWGEHAGTDAAATCVLTGNGIPTAATGKNGDSYIDLDSWDFYVRDNDAWAKVGNIKGGDGAQGSSVNVGHGDPTTGNVSGHAGDTYIDLETGNYYNYDENNGWGEPIGSGAIGASLRTGTTAPAADLGNNGDSYINTTTWDYYVKENGAWVLQSNFAGRDGISISKVERTSGTGAAGTTDTYTITYSDSTQENPHVDTFTVTNGTDGNKIIVGTGAPTDATEANVGDNYIDVETWKLYVKAADTWEDKGSFKGDPGVSIVSVEFKERNALIDVYEITYSDSTNENPHVDTFTVTNGKDGTSVRTGHRDPRAVNDDPTTAVDETLAAVEGIEGDSFIDLDTWNYFVLTDDGEGNLVWNPEGNLHYSPNRYTVTFDSNGGSPVDSYDEALEGFTIVVPDAPTQDGYFFQGWYTAEGTRWDFSKDVVTKDTTLTARWGQFIVEDGLIKDCSITSGDIVIPEYYDNQLVIGIADEAFKNKTGITSFTLPHTVKSIGNSAFEGCTGLTSVVIPSNVKSIGQDAFKGCSNVVYVYIEDGAANPGISSFRGPSQSNGLETIGSGAFAGCSSLKGIVLPSTIKSIGKGAFEDCDSLESYTAPFIGGSAEASVSWAYCYGAGEPTTTNPSNNVYLDTESGYIWVKANDVWNKSEMAVPLNMLINGAPTGSANNGDVAMDIETGNLYGYQNDTWISYMNLLDNPQMADVLSNYLTNATYLSFVFGGSSYDDNNSALPSSLKTVTITGDYAIDTNAMNGCDDIEAIIISGNPSSIGFGAFANCYDLKSITLPYIGPDSSYVAPLTYSYGHGEPDTVNPTTTTYFDLDSNHYWQYYNDQWVDLTEDKSDATLDAIASGTGVVIGTEFPSSGSFLNYETGVLYTYYNENWVPFSNLLDYTNALPTSNSYLGYIFGANNMENQDSEIPSNLDTIILTGANGDNGDCIPSYAFYGCDAKNIVLPNNVREIGDYAFGETEITSFVVPNSVEYLGKGVFKDSEISELTLPFLGKNRDTLSVADATLDYLFDNRSNNVETVILTGGNGANRDTIPDFAFTSSKVAKVVIPEGVTKIGADAFHFCLNLTSISLPSTLKVIGTACFYQTSHLTELNLPQGLARIEAGALADTKCTTLVIPSSVTYIGDRAFRYNSHLKSVVFQDGADKQFGDNVFQDCDALENVYLGHGITKVNNKMFANLKSLKVVALAETITEIGDLAFKNCTSLKTINLPANLESIGIQAFYHCTGLESFVMPNSVTSIGRMAFEGCISLKNLTLSESLEKIEVQTFEGCTSLQAVALPSNLKELGTRTFFGCTSLKYIVLNEGLENISEFAFTGCDSLESIVIPDSVKDIGRGAFSTGLTRKGNLWDTYSPERTEHAIIQVTSTHDLPVAGEIGDIIIFTDADHYGEIWVRYDSGNKWELRDTIVGFELFYDSISPTSIESGKLFINSVDGDLLVEYSSKLNSITLPFIGGSVSSIGDHILSGALANDEKPSDDLGIDNDLYVDTAHSQIFRKINGKWHSQVVFTLENGSVGTMQVGDTDPTGASTNDCYYINTATGMYWLGTDTSWGETKGNVKDIFNSFGYAFVRAGSKHNHDSLNSMVPNTIRTVVICNGAELIDGAFRGFTNIETIVLPKTLVSIGDYAFEGCTSLSLLNLEEGLLSIGDYAFRNTALVNINIPDTVTSLGVRAIELSSSLETVKLGSGLTKVEYGLFNDCSNLKTVILGSGITEIDEYAFYHCSSLEAIAIPTGVTEIKGYAFDGCSSLNYVYIPEGVTTIYERAFANCSSLTALVLPTTLQNVGIGVFAGCNQLESLSTPLIGGKADGAFNATILAGELADGETPDTSLGNDNDFYIDAASAKIYRKLAGEWHFQFTMLKYNGDVPATVYYGTTGSPANSLGAVGDYYFNLTTGLFKVKIYSSYWSTLNDNPKLTDCFSQMGYWFFNAEGTNDFTSFNAGVPSSFKNLTFNYDNSVFAKGCLKGVNVVSMTMPFIGGSVTENNYLGYLFGANSYSYNSSTVPNSLANIEITGDYAIADYACRSVYNLTNLIISGNPVSIGQYAFGYCGLSGSLLISGEPGSIGQYAFANASPASVVMPLMITFEDAFGTTSSNSNTMGTIVITRAGGANNDEIVDNAFKYVNAKNVILPDGVTRIGDYAFYSMKNIETIYIPDTVTSFGDYAFSYSDINSISLPSQLLSIGERTFSSCNKLTSIVIPDSVTTIGKSVFNSCYNLTYVKLGSGITEIPEQAFNYCPVLKNVETGDVVTIGKQAFYCCYQLESFILSSNLQTIGEQVFYCCYQLRAVAFKYQSGSNALTAIGKQAFYNCSSLLTINFRSCSNLETLGQEAFAYCRSLTSANIDGKADIPYECFQYCESLTSVILGWNIKKIGSYAFQDCKSLVSFDYCNVEEIGSDAFYDCYSLIYVFSSSSNANLKKIGYSAFSHTSLQNVVIPKTVTYIGSSIFGYVNSVVTISVPFLGEDRDHPSDQGINYLFNNQSTGLVNIQSIIVTDAPSLGNYAFGYCENATSIVVNDSCESFGYQPFYKCYNLKYLHLPNNLKTFGNYTFEYCYSLTSVSLPNTLESIPEYCFAYTKSLREVIIPDSVETISHYAFEDSDIETVILGSGVKTIENNAFYNRSDAASIKTVVLNEGLETIGEGAFFNTLIESIVIPGSVTSIGSSAFYNCRKLSYVVINDGVQSIGQGAFQYTAIKSIVIPESMMHINIGAFGYCFNLETITIPFVGCEPNAADIDDGSFGGPFSSTPKLKTVVVTGDATIAPYAFRDFEFIETIAILGKPSSIGAGAFDGCSLLNTLVLPYVGASNSLGNIIVGSNDPNELFWPTTSNGNITLNPNSSVIVYENYTGDLDDLDEGTIVVFIEQGKVTSAVKTVSYYDTSRNPYLGDDVTLPYIVNSNWIVDGQDTGLAAPDGGLDDLQFGDSATILASTYEFNDDDPWMPFVDINTLDIYFVQNFEQSKDNWTWVNGGNFKKAGSTVTITPMLAPNFSTEEEYEEFVDSLTIGQIILIYDFGYIGEVYYDSLNDMKQLRPYEGDALCVPYVTSTWFIGDTNTGVDAGSPFSGYRYGYGNPTTNNVSPDARYAYIDLGTLDIYFVANANDDSDDWAWSSNPNGNLKKTGSTATIVTEEWYNDSYWNGYLEDEWNLSSLDEGTIIVSLENNTVTYTVRTYHYYNDFQDYYGDVGYYFPYILNGHWYIRDIDLGTTNTQYSQYYRVGNGDPNSNNAYCDEDCCYIDLDTFNFYIPRNTGEDGDVFVSSDNGGIYRKTNGVWNQENHLASGTILSGSTDPLDSEGDDGNYYINTVTGQAFRKVSGSWVEYSNITDFFTRMNYWFMVFGGNQVWVPKTLKNITITGDNDINDSALQGCKYVEKVTLTGNPQHIGNNAFKDCLSLKSFIIPDSVLTIGDSAFENCPLQSIDLGNNVVSVGKNAFANCNGWELVDARTGHGAPLAYQTAESGDFYIDLTNGNLSYMMNYGWQLEYVSYNTSNKTPEEGIASYQHYEPSYFWFYNSVWSDSRILYINTENGWVNTGLSVYLGSETPTAGNDYLGCKWYFDRNERDFYILQNNVWVKNALENIVVGHGVPTSSGNEDDYYIDLDTNRLYCCAGGTTWNIVFEGINFLCGYCTDIESQKAPLNGDLYLDLDTNNVYEFKDNEWSLETDVNMTINSSVSDTPINTVVNAEVGDFYLRTNGDTLYKKSSNGLSVIVFGNKLATIGDGAFRDNRGLTSVAVPTNVTSIGFGAFEGCNSIETMIIPFIGGAVSYDMSSSDSPYFAYIFGGVIWNDSYVAYDSKVPSSLKKVTILTSNLYEESDGDNSTMVPHIPAMAFAQCSSIEELNLPNDYEEIYDYAFYGCSSLESFVFSNKCLGADNYAFANCSSLQYISIPETIETGNLISLYGGIISLYLGDYAFANCTSLKTVYIPNSVGFLGMGCFKGCNSLSSLVMPAFADDRYLAIYNSINIMPNSTNRDPDPNTDEFNYWLNTDTGDLFINYLGDIVQYNVKGSGNISMDSSRPSVASEGDRSLDLNYLDMYEYQGGVWKKIFNVSFMPLSFLFGNDSSDIPESLKTVKYNAVDGVTPLTYAFTFSGCTHLEKIIIPDNTSYIGDYAFARCLSLESLVLPNDLVSIGDSAFLYCERIVNINLGDTAITHIGNGAFQSCTSAIYASLPQTLTTLEGVFWECFSLKQVFLPDDLISLNNGTFYGCSSLVGVYLPDTLQVIGEETFSSCHSLSDITIPASVYTIGADAFRDCTSLTTLVIPDNVSSIGQNVLAGCNNLQSLTIPFVGCGIVSNGEAADQNMTWFFYLNEYELIPSLKTVTLTGGNGYDGDTVVDNAFSGAIYIEQIVLGEGIKYIGLYAFSNCSRLKTIELPSAFVSVGQYAFAGCYQLTTIYYSSSKEAWASVNIANYNYLTGVIVRCTNGTIQLS